MIRGGGDQAESSDVIRRPLWFRVLITVAVAAWYPILLRNLADLPFGVVFGAVCTVFGATLLYRTLRVSVEMGPDVLVARNTWWTRRIPYADIEGFDIGTMPGQPFIQAIHVLVRGGRSTPLEVTTLPTLPSARAWQLDQLRRWSGRP